MIRRYLGMAKGVLKWGKILLPHTSLRFYPPQFTLRNPVIEGVKAAFKAGHEVVVIVFNFQNIGEMAEHFDDIQHSQLLKRLNRFFLEAALEELTKQDIISLNDFYDDGLTLFIQVDYDQHYLSEIERVMKRLADNVERKFYSLYPSVKFQFDSGYMFVEKRHYSVEGSIAKAHRHAIAMAEKRLASKYDNMVFTLNKIVAKKNIRLLAQPIINVATNEIYAYEMLTRGPAGTALEAPLPLFSVARQTGMLYELEMIVIEKAFEQVRATRCRHHIFVNCTPLTLGNIRFTRDVKNLMQKFGTIPPKQITFEVTENESIAGLKNFIYNIKRLRLMGFKIAIDDTGSGYSNMSTIGEIMPDVIKIDQSVIHNIDKDSLKESMLKGLLLIAKEAGSLVVAEGIERKEEASVLSRHNVDLAQGNFYSPPTILMADIAT